MKTPEAVRKRLEEARVWLPFKMYREELKRSGVSTTDAYKRALYRFDPDPAAVEAERQESGENSVLEKIRGGMRAKGAGGAQNEMSDFADYPEYEEEMMELADRSASEVDQIRWVVRNVDNPGVTPGDCPDPAAWTLLLNCRSSSSFKDTFLLNVWPKIVPSRAQLDNVNTNEGDGDDQIELLKRVADAAERAVKDAKEKDRGRVRGDAAGRARACRIGTFGHGVSIERCV